MVEVAERAQSSYYTEPVSMAELISETLDWATRNPSEADARLDALDRLLPSGSGIDSGTQIARDWADSVRWNTQAYPGPETAFLLTSSWHAMTSDGYYAGWHDFTVEVFATFSGPSVSLSWRSGKNPEESYPVEPELIDCPECAGTGVINAGEEGEADCPDCDDGDSSTGQIEDPDAEWFGVSDPTEYLVDLYREAMRSPVTRIEIE